MAAPEADEADSFASVGISTCLLLLCAGTLLAYLLHLAAQRAPRRLRPWLRPPTESWLWALLGLVAGLVLEFGLSARLAAVVEIVDASFPTLFFSALLPPIIFRSGYGLDAASFARALWPASLLAGPGTVVSALVVGVLLFLAGALRVGCFPFSLLQALLLGSVVSATDTVAVLTTLAEGASAAPIGRDLFSLVYGESVLNDAVALVLFRTLAAAERSGDAASLAGAAWAVASFAGVFVGSTLVGVGVGCATALLFKHFRLRRARGPTAAAPAQAAEGAEGAVNAPAPAEAAGAASPAISAFVAEALATDAADGAAAEAAEAGEVEADGEGGLEGEVERTLFCVLPFLSYFIAEGASLSGVVAVLFCGIVVGKTAQHNVSAATRSFARALFQMLASLFEALVFVYVGIALPQLGGAAMRAHWPTALALVAACLLGRAAGVWLCSAIVNRGGGGGSGGDSGAGWAAPPLAQWPAAARRHLAALAAGCAELPARA
jgi:NhaP-type Na+/H+ or K+/H+ antiporter